jgi:hypothetical protein
MSEEQRSLRTALRALHQRLADATHAPEPSEGVIDIYCQLHTRAAALWPTDGYITHALAPDLPADTPDSVWWAAVQLWTAQLCLYVEALPSVAVPAESGGARLSPRFWFAI